QVRRTAAGGFDFAYVSAAHGDAVGVIVENPTTHYEEKLAPSGLGRAKARPYNGALVSWRRKLVGKFEADDAPERLHAVLPGDFFSFFICAAGVSDGDLVDAPT